MTKKNASPSSKDTNAAKKTNDSTARTTEVSAKRPNRQSLLTSLLVRAQGAPLNDMIAATAWLPHTTRAALTGLKKGYAISSEKVDAVRTYRAVAPE